MCLRAEEMVIEYLMASPRLLTSWCWRQKVFPAFSASAPRTDASKEVHQELLMGFDVSNNHKHSVLSMVVKRQHEGGQQASVWSVDLQVHVQKLYALTGHLFSSCFSRPPYLANVAGDCKLQQQNFDLKRA